MEEKLLEALDVLDDVPTWTKVSQDVKDRLAKTAKALAIEDVADEDPSEDKSQTQDPPPNHDEQRRLYQLATEGIVVAPPPAKAVEPTEIPPVEQLRRQFYDLMLETLIGEEHAG